MKKLLLLGLSLILISSSSAMAQEEPVMTPELEAFGHKITEVFASAEKEAYMGILHPACPEPVEARLDWQLSSKWKPDTADIRLKNVSAIYDLEQLDFTVEPEYAFEFQVMTVKPDGTERELVTSYPVAQHEGEYKILDFPCFEPKKAE